MGITLPQVLNLREGFVWGKGCDTIDPCSDSWTAPALWD